MSFFNKLKVGSASAGQSVGLSNTKKDPNAPILTLLEQRLADVTGPIRADGSDKFFGFENYGSTCYCNSIIQCLYYSAPFRENILNFPIQPLLDIAPDRPPNTGLSASQTHASTPYPNLASPARKPAVPTTPGSIVKPEDSKDSPEYRKRQALTVGPVLDIIQDNSAKYGTNESLFTSLRDIFEAIIGHASRTGVVSPHRFLEILRRENEMFRSAMHQDAHEFLNLLLNQVMDSMDTLSKQHPLAFASQDKVGALDVTVAPNGLQVPTKNIDANWVHDLFEGHLTSETRCLTCENTSQRDEPFLDISVDLSPHTSVTSCLRKFSEEEMLCEQNKFHCDNCGGLQEAEKRMKIKRLPRILALHLKRFKYTEDLQRLQKLFHRVVYPFHLRLFNTTDDAEDSDRLYELYAVVVHIGGGPYHGHYVSIIKTQDRGWLLFDDEMVEPVDQSYVLNFFGGEPSPQLQDARQLACAYVLFYQETTLDAVLREQEAEDQRTSGQASDAEAAKESVASPILQPTNPIATTLAQDVPSMEKLAHAVTTPSIPILSHPTRPNMPHLATAGPMPVTTASKSKKELKQEEKERKAAEKAKQKADDKATTDRNRSRPADEETKYSLDTSTTDEARRRGDDASTTSTSTDTPPFSIPTRDKEASGLSRFRPAAMSLRGKRHRLFSSSKDKSAGEPLPVVHANGNGVGAGTSLASSTSVATGEMESASESRFTALPLPPAAPATINGADWKRGRFSLGRKKSTALS